MMGGGQHQDLRHSAVSGKSLKHVLGKSLSASNDAALACISRSWVIDGSASGSARWTIINKYAIQCRRNRLKNISDNTARVQQCHEETVQTGNSRLANSVPVVAARGIAMILSDLRNYLNERKRVTLSDLVNRFDTDAEVLRGMLLLLERKGRVRKLPATACNAGCNKCDGTSLELYESVEN